MLYLLWSIATRGSVSEDTSTLELNNLLDKLQEECNDITIPIRITLINNQYRLILLRDVKLI